MPTWRVFIEPVTFICVPYGCSYIMRRKYAGKLLSACIISNIEYLLQRNICLVDEYYKLPFALYASYTRYCMIRTADTDVVVLSA